MSRAGKKDGGGGDERTSTADRDKKVMRECRIVVSGTAVVVQR